MALSQSTLKQHIASVPAWYSTPPFLSPLRDGVVPEHAQLVSPQPLLPQQLLHLALVQCRLQPLFLQHLVKVIHFLCG